MSHAASVAVLAQDTDAPAATVDVPFQLFVLGAEEAEGAFPTSGTMPHQRPEPAPTIRTAERTGAWYQQALTGIEAPYPASLRFLDDQELWHTPFNRPGMTGPYDIRNWHGAAADVGGSADVPTQ